MTESTAAMPPGTRTIRLAHSPDSDDAFMFYALAEGLIDTGDLHFVHELQDIQTLNERALRGELDVSAVSIHAFAYLTDRYFLLPHGASMGEGYGPRVVGRRPMDPEELRTLTVATPGRLTSAFLAIKLWEPGIRTVTLPFNQIMEAVASGRVDAGLIIHEGQLTYKDAGLELLLDLGRWWADDTGGLPLPLGGNVIRRDLGPELVRRVSRLLRASIRYSLDHRKAAMCHAMRYAGELDESRAGEFVEMYVNERTLDYGDEGRRAVRLFLERGVDAGWLPGPIVVDFADE